MHIDVYTCIIIYSYQMYNVYEGNGQLVSPETRTVA